jgi:GAF domain-containing protein
MTLEPASQLFRPADADAARRVTRLRELSLGDRPEHAFDEFAQAMAEAAEAPLAMVNFLREDRQYFAGLHAPEFVQGGPGAIAAADDPARFMTMDQGWCPHVVALKLARVLDDVYAYPRFSGNPVVDQFGIRAYMGAPLIDSTGTVLGTVCVVDTERRAWGRDGLSFIKDRAAEMIETINQRRL